MYIARLLLKGFKSFGGSHDLPLSPGMTAIVGPNGSGKSNLLDALRWALGDSHASKLRISRQGDLLFQGSASRGAASEAEIAIQLRESTRVATIRRRVSDAGAQVFVDGARVTLNDLEDVKRRWQLGGDRFAFIGQGDVTEVIQQRPSARRVLLESLFGIDAYRKRRTEAAERLAEARAEYDRLRTFSAELASRRAEIAPEVERAAAAREILDALEDERKLLYWVRRARNDRAMANLRADMEALSGELALREAWGRRWERSLAYLDGSLSQLSATRQNQVRELEEAKASLANFTRTAYGYGATLKNEARRASQIALDRAELTENVERLRGERAASERERDRASQTLASDKKRLEEAEGRYRAQRDALERNRAERESRAREKGELEGEIAALKGRMRSLGLALLELKGGGEGKRASDPLRDIKQNRDDLEKRYETLLGERDEAAELHRDTYAKLQEVSADLQKSRRESSRLSRSLFELQEQARVEVYPRPVQHVLSAAKLGRLDARPCAVIDAFVCPPELATAMEAFLGGRQFWLLVETMDEAGRCIDQLKSSQMGRATFLPLERCRERRRDDAHRLPGDGVVGWATELIAPDRGWASAISHLMGDLLIVEDYATGQSLVRGGFRGPVATLEGDIFQPAGSISGGKAQKSGKAIELKAALSKMERDASDAAALAERLTEVFARLEEEEARAEAAKEELSQAIRGLSAERSALDARREEIMRERARAKSERESITAQLTEGGRVYADLCRRRRALGAEAPEEAAEVDEKLIREVESIRGRVAVAEEKLRSGFALSERLIAELRGVERGLSSLDEEAQECDREIVAQRANLTRLARRYTEVAVRRRIVTAEMEDFACRYDEIAHRRERRSARAEASRLALAEARGRSATHEARAADLAREQEELIATWEAQYPYPGEAAFEDADPDELRRGIRERDRNLKALGPVDMGMLSEDRSLRDRLAYLGDQLDDVKSGAAELERLIADADEQARVIFSNALEEIDRKFDALFRRLFGGGDARLEMTPGESLWDSGVDVIARPPGKHPQSIAQLSGGEQSLSAIALLFASLEVAQCPIAVLDEVDAALDEVNLRRFADLAKDASRERQIFVMTHRRVTMERADVLYGVTLAEPGLSQVIGVRVEDWS